MLAFVGAKEILSGISAPPLTSPSRNASGSSAFLARNSRMRGTWALSWLLQSAISSVMDDMPSTSPGSMMDLSKSVRWLKPIMRRASAK